MIFALHRHLDMQADVARCSRHRKAARRDRSTIHQKCRVSVHYRSRRARGATEAGHDTYDMEGDRHADDMALSFYYTAFTAYVSFSLHYGTRRHRYHHATYGQASAHFI